MAGNQLENILEDLWSEDVKEGQRSPLKCLQSDSPLKLSLSKKRPRLSCNWSKCIVCQQDRLDNKLSIASKAGIATLRSSAALRKDQIAINRLNDFKDDACENIVYHRLCYQTFTSKSNLVHVMLPSSQSYDNNQSSSYLLTRSNAPKFDIACCIICLKKSHKKDRKLHKIETKEREACLRLAAEKHADDAMLLRIRSEDLIAMDVVYHSACLSTYITTAPATTYSPLEQSLHDSAFQKLIDEIQEDLMENKKAFVISHLLEIYKSYLPSGAQSYTSQKLQNKLTKHYGSNICIQSQQGQSKSNFILSSHITLHDAIDAASQLKQELKSMQFENEVDVTSARDSVESTLYKAATILRQDITACKTSKEYPSVAEMNLLESCKALPPLIKFLLWLISLDQYNTFSDVETAPDMVLRQAITLSDMILSANKKAMTPLHVGLAVHLYHEYGSRNLIEILHAHGVCISYDELRRFTTSIAEKELCQVENGVYVPGGLVPIADGGSFLQEGNDNIDINAETVDGKNTLHAMATVVFQQRKNTQSVSTNTEVLRTQAKSLTETEKCESLLKPLFFNKPTVRAQPRRHMNAADKIKELQGITELSVLDITWVMMRCLSRGWVPFTGQAITSKCQTVPFWTGFNTCLSEPRKSFMMTAYVPVIDAKPSDMSTVYTTMKRCMDRSSALGQVNAVQTIDLQLYAIGQQVRWTCPEEFQGHTLRLGGFHTLCTFIASIGKLWGDGGLRDMLVDSELYAGCTADMMLMGKQFKRAMRGLTLVYEALCALLLRSFFDWGEKSSKFMIPDILAEALLEAQTAVECGSDDAPEKLLVVNTQLTNHMTSVLQTFIDESCKASVTFKYWFMFLQAIQILLDFNRAERQGQWRQHLESISSMLPYFFAADRSNYARWTPVYILDMLSLPEPVQKSFDEGQFAIRLIPGGFNNVWSDMATEMTIIKDAKGVGGIIGMTRKKSAMVRWTLTRHVMGEYSKPMKQRTGIEKTERTEHEETRSASIKQDEAHVQALVDHIKEKMTDPFDTESHPEVLMNISSGVHATAVIQESLLSAVEKGKDQADQFITGCLESGNTRNFYSPITRSCVKTFAEMTKKTKIKSGGQGTMQVSISPELIFRRALILVQSRDDITVETIMSRPMGAVPTSLFHDDGTMRKATKSDLGHRLEDQAERHDEMPPYHPDSAVHIVDSMSVVQALDGGKYKSFGDVAEEYMKRSFKALGWADTIIEVFDRYDVPNSVKDAERSRRGAGLQYKEYEVIAGRGVPQWKRFLSVGKNKTNLIEFLADYIGKNAPNQLKWNQTIYLAGVSGGKVIEVTEQGARYVDHLACNQEEADTKIIFYALLADQIFESTHQKGRIIVKSPDTDVLVLCVHYFSKFRSTKEMWIQTGIVTGTTDLRRFIPVHEICHNIAQEIQTVLPAIHALTGCDSTSAFFGKGKSTVLKVALENLDVIQSLKKMASASTSADFEEAISAAQQFVVLLYDQKQKIRVDGLNKLRVKMANQSKMSLIKLPPCEASFREHVKRAIWQTKVWTSSHVTHPSIGTPTDHGWRQENDHLSPVLFEGPMASEALDDLICSCKGCSVCNTGCSCSQQEIACTELCPCAGNERCCNSYISVQETDDSTEQD